MPKRKPVSSATSTQKHGKHPGGRPRSYNPLMVELLDAQEGWPAGATIAEIAESLGVSYPSIYNWMEEYEDFRAAVFRARSRADKLVEKSMFAAACGYEHPEDKIFCLKDGTVVTEHTTKHYPPDINAAKFWLTNRSKKAQDVERWVDKQEQDLKHSGKIIVIESNVDADNK